ncbi:transcriptional regulator [Cryobacterium melibiosiphilum]|uniref:Transcriptional regulator n=1 Tax=Cryobacterium melibiosiphilum TaxID=995039 RepID=A0A3A5MTB9_9MICO|nr:helix-turn-helix domain-containing protein [Cryobacterium melibiosiphilum]RJT88474.1 transcriptional regulator [Cryobacterium melibiosiphilum]
MYRRPDGTPTTCQVARSLDIVGERWSLLIVRNALRGQTRFGEFRDGLGIPTDILASRLATLVTAGVLDKRPYREPGCRERSSYHLTPAGQGLDLALAALIQWGDTFNPAPEGAGSRLVDPATGAPARVAVVDAAGRELPAVGIVPGPAAITVW